MRLALAVAVVAILAGCGGGKSHQTTTKPAARQILVQLQEQNFSGEAGTATLTSQGSKTRVSIVMASAAGNAQPAHIHKGTCASLDATPAYALPNVVRGKSTTVVAVSLDTLLKGTYAINLHRSVKNLNEYVACGDISENAAPAQTVRTGEEGSG